MSKGPGAPTQTLPPRSGTIEPTEHLAAPPGVEELSAGAGVGRYEVVRCVGRGGMGVVYEARDLALGRRVALKFLRSDALPGDPSRSERLLREARLAGGMSHPNIVVVYEVGLHDSGPYIAMEYIDGVTVREWLAAAPRTWREIRDVFVEAGRGIAAAHAIGIVHRDVKPANILVAADRARIADFGLARAAERAEPASPASPIEATRGTVTQAGAIVGTPQYMAPEQRTGGRADAASDQYSFCVSLAEALEQRPDVPAWLVKVVARGLREAPEERHPDMTALLRDLGRDPALRRRRVATLLAGAALLTAGAAGVTWGVAQRPTVCRDAAQPVAAVWNDARKGALRAAFAKTERAHAEGTFARVAARLDGYAVAWAASRTDACEATHVRGEQSATLLDLRMRCLDRQLARLDALLGALSSPSAAAVDGAVDVIDDATEELCRDAEALAAAVPLPSNPSVRARVEELERQLDGVAAVRNSARHREAESELLRILPEVRAIGYAPLLAEALLQRMWIENYSNRPEQALATLNEILPLAASARNDELIARVWNDILRLTGLELGRHEAALAFVPAVEAAVARAGGRPADRAAYARILGLIFHRLGRMDDARTELERASILAEGHGLDGSRHGLILNGLGMLHWQQGRFAEAGKAYRRAIEVLERHYGRRHRDVLVPLVNLGLALRDAGTPAAAREVFAEGLDIARELYPADHPRIAAIISHLGTLALHTGDLDGAERHHREALAMTERARPGDHPDLARDLYWLGKVALERRQFDAAEAPCARARRIYDTSGVRILLAERAASCLGQARLGLGRSAEAIEPLEAALTLALAIGAPRYNLAQDRYFLARALYRSGRDRRRATILAREALAALAPDAPLRAAIEDELAGWNQRRR